MLSQKEKHFARREKVHGQFLTPSQVAAFIVRFVTASGAKTNLGIDPACGDGVFLKALVDANFVNCVGIDIDPKVLGRLPFDIKSTVKTFEGNGLLPLPFMEGIADAVVGNPPFSAKYGRVNDPAILSNFDLGKGRKSQAIEILFLERFLQLASPDGVIGIILPEGVFSAIPLEYVRRFLKNRASVLGVVSLPRGIFSNRTTSKTCVLFAQKRKRLGRTFMGIAQRLDDLPSLLEAYTTARELEYPPAFWVEPNVDSFEPEFYWTAQTSRPKFRDGLTVKRLGDLLSEIRNGGTEYGETRKFAGQGIPFISAKNITPLGIDFSRREKYVEPNSPMDKKWAHVSKGDVLFVRVGVGCSGRAAAVVDDEDIGIADDWLYILRPKRVSPFYLALFFYTRPGKSQINRFKRGVGTVNIAQRLLKQTLVPLPSESFQTTIDKGYVEMVNLRRQGRINEAKALFEHMISDIENAIGAT